MTSIDAESTFTRRHVRRPSVPDVSWLHVDPLTGGHPSPEPHHKFAAPIVYFPRSTSAHRLRAVFTHVKGRPCAAARHVRRYLG